MKLRVKIMTNLPKIVLILKNVIYAEDISLWLKKNVSMKIAQTIIRN
jgi:hypothetical protein